MITTSGHPKSRRESLMMLTTDVLFACSGFWFLLLPPTAVSKKQKRKSAPLLIIETVQEKTAKHASYKYEMHFSPGGTGPKEEVVEKTEKSKTMSSQWWHCSKEPQSSTPVKK